MTKFLKFKILFLLSVFYFLFSASSAGAAKLNLTSQFPEIGIGQQFQADLILDAEGESINAVEGRVAFPAGLLELKEIRDGNSIVNLWIDKPRERQETRGKEQGEIVFSGITPGGFQGDNGLIFSVIFEAKAEGQGAIEVREAKALLNDGQGTAAPLTISNFQFLISKQAPISSIPITGIKDIERPESFAPEVANDPNIFDGKWFLVFATQDKSSGIERYEAKETRQRFFGIFSKWISAESPYVLQDQELRSLIFVKAVDKAGNKRIEKILPRNPLRWYENYENWIIIILALIVICAIRKFL